VFLNIGKHDLAVKCFEETMEIEGRDEGTLYFIGEAWFAMGDMDKARQYYLESLELDANYVDARIGLAYVYNDKDDFESALQHIELAILAESTNSEAHQLKGDVLLNLDRFDDAITALRKSVLLDPQNVDAWLILSEAHLHKSGFEEAFEIISEAERSLEEIGLLLYRKAVYLFDAGKLKEGELVLLEALSINATELDSFFEYNEELRKNAHINEIIANFTKNH
jgi:tetratricopeptide (TPR) repeat protein